MAPSIYLKAYRCQNGREIHYASALLYKDPSSTATSIIDVDDPDLNASISGKIGACWIFFYPVGPNRRLLEAVISRYSSEFECDNAVLFLSVNRPGKGGTSSSVNADSIGASDEVQHIRTTCDDVVSILDYYSIPKASLLYICAGSTFAYSFAAQYPQRTTGYIIGIASWVLRSDPPSATSCSCNSEHSQCDNDIKTPETLYSEWSFRAKMGGFLVGRRNTGRSQQNFQQRQCPANVD